MLEDRSQPDFGEFSLVLGGPLFQLLRRAHLSDDALMLVRQRIIVISLLSWLPLLVLSALAGNMLGGKIAVPFLVDFEVHVRFLVAMPLLLVAELVVHQRMRFLVTQFLERNLIPESAMTQFKAAITSAFRLRNSVLAEVLLIAFVYIGGVLIIWRHYITLDAATWYATPSADGSKLSLAGMWYGYVSLPLFQFLLCRWYFRIFIWTRFLWQVSRIDLRLVPTHPDRVGGIGFLSNTIDAYVPLLVAHGALLAALIGNRIYHLGAKLTEFKLEIVVLVTFLIFVVLGPLLFFAPQLARPNVREIASMEASPNVTCASSMPSGCVTVPMPMSSLWAAQTSSPSPTCATVSKSCGLCTSRLLPSNQFSCSRARPSRRWSPWYSP